MRRVLIVVVTLALAGLAAPAHAAVGSTVDWTGDNAGWAAQPLVQEVEGRMTLLLSGPFQADYSSTAPESDRYWPRDSVIVDGGVSRSQTSKVVTYTSETKQCTRKVSKKYPATIKADRKAVFTCKSRPASVVDESERVEALRPTALIVAAPGTTEVIGMDSAVQPAPAKVFSGAVYASADTRPEPLRYGYYTVTADGLDIEWNNCDSAGRDCKVVLKSGNVPSLPSMSKLKH